MDQPYSAWADWLSKFHTWPEPIQALWLVMGPLTLLGMTWIVMRGLRDILHALRRNGGHLRIGVHSDERDRMVFNRPEPAHQIERQHPLELIGHDRLSHGLRGPDRT